MISNLRPASDTEIEHLLANPQEITRFLYGADADNCERVVLNKAWHAIHFALTGSRLDGDERLNFLVSEGTPVGEIDVGFGPARVLIRLMTTRRRRTSSLSRQKSRSIATPSPCISPGWRRRRGAPCMPR